MFFKRLYIKVCRYLFRKKYLPILSGNLKGYLWSVNYNYEYLLGTYEEEKVLKQLLDWCKPTSNFYDIGANVGFYSLLANTKISEGKIYSFEPIPTNIQVFKNHLQLNSNKLAAKNIYLKEFAIADATKQVSFSNHSLFIDGNTYVEKSFVHNESLKKIIIQAYSIDDLIKENYPLPDIIKIDVEGAELDVLKGLTETIHLSKPNIFLATHDCHIKGIKDDCLHFLKSLNYVYVHTGNHNKNFNGLDDYFAVHQSKINELTQYKI